MKDNANYNGVGIETNSVTKSSQKFKIGNASKIIKMLRDKLYSKPSQTMVQEYLANGRDSHREAARTNPDALSRPMSVTLPTKHEPVLKIRDFGVGISPERMSDVFIQYGNTTKSDDDNQNGGFGIGAKIGFAYTDGFTIVTCLNKVKRTYIAHIGNNSDGTLEEISEEATTEDNGTEIQIPIKLQDIDTIKKSFWRATLFWETRPEIKGVIPEEIPSFYKNVSSQKIYSGKNWNLYTGQELSQFLENVSNNSYYNNGVYLIIDGIPYALSSGFFDLESVRDLRQYINNKLTLTIHVGNKDIEVNPNREQLSQSEFSKNNVDKICKEIFLELQAQIKAEVENCKDLNHYFETHRSINKTLQNKVETSFTFKGRTYGLDGNNILSSELQKSSLIEAYSLSKLSNGKKIVNRQKTSRLLIREKGKFLINDTTDGLGKIRERIRNFFNGETEIPVYLIQKHPEAQLNDYQNFVSDLSVEKLSSLPLPIVEKTKTTRANNKGKICLQYISLDENSRYRIQKTRVDKVHILPSEINSKQKYLYLEIKENKMEETKVHLPALTKFLNQKGYKVVGLSSLSLQKINSLKLNNFTPLKDFIKDFSEHFPLNANQKMAFMKTSWYGIGKLSKVSTYLDKLQDPELVSLIEFDQKIREIPDNEAVPRDLLELYKEESLEAEKSLSKQKDLLNKLTERYPLISQTNFYSDNTNVTLEELLLYINLKYKSLKKKG